jgi:hypothetical protein
MMEHLSRPTTRYRRRLLRTQRLAQALLRFVQVTAHWRLRLVYNVRPVAEVSQRLFLLLWRRRRRRCLLSLLLTLSVGAAPVVVRTAARERRGVGQMTR